MKFFLYSVTGLDNLLGDAWQHDGDDDVMSDIDKNLQRPEMYLCIPDHAGGVCRQKGLVYYSKMSYI